MRVSSVVCILLVLTSVCLAKRKSGTFEVVIVDYEDRTSKEIQSLIPDDDSEAGKYRLVGIVTCFGR